MEIKKIAVIGAGTMGNGIAHVFAQNNFSVNLIDVSQPQLEKAFNIIEKNLERQLAKNIISADTKNKTLANIASFTSIERGVSQCDLAIEAATENESIKLKIFKELDELSPASCLLASNTSSISITKIASATHRPEKVIGMHFMNPVPVMKLVEIINGYSTQKEVTDTIIAISQKIGKIPCVVNDYPGFIANRILMPMINEAIFSLYENVAGVEEIDTVMKLGMAHPMGPLQLADFIGLDVCHAILTVLFEGFGNSKYAPCPLLTNMVHAQKLGVKTGEGFYKYTVGSKDRIVSDRFR
ncbi:3-hydroxyacyl-CoA dehydrogenase family protein [Hanamia caeni]|jgi:3-hydroxybutyryl-CoA dehydrogenase|uniref:3-hydroxyacyl-CoA dehydrogenase family protein n=1 Tax=Hanamia caeni TaxID=2294116 RepID=UPI0018F6D34A|nr:3-hydroxyacyl-CoA dehydrogenase NAD-binding domain-containing protein [Hanamia caeni]